MRRNLFGLLAAFAPALALGVTPSSGTIVFDGSTDQAYVNLAQCNGTQNDVRADKLTVDLTWAVAETDTVKWASGGTYRLYVTNKAPDTTASNATSCVGSSDSTFRSQPVGTGADLSVGTDANPMLSAVSVSRKDVAAAHMLANASTAACGTSLPTTIYLCVEWRQSGAPKLRATGTMTYDVVGPTDAPKLNDVGPGDGQLYPSWDASSGADRYKAFAVVAGDQPHVSGEITDRSATIKGLQNGTTYDVYVYALDPAGNPSPKSNVVKKAPEPVNDFWDIYHGAGGRESGGCSTGADGALALLGAAAALFAARRRKP